MSRPTSQAPDPGWHTLIGRLAWQGDLSIAQFETMPSAKGVYMLHATANGARASIGRALGTDADGVLLIGESTDLRTRGTTLAAAMQYADATKIEPSHRPGLEYSPGWGYDFARRFPIEHVLLRWYETDHHKLLEAALLERYRWEFLDRPPLNASIGNWRGHGRENGWIKIPR
ncbi:MAG: hypothetical protein R3B06_03880 [Kofleriaceae bacterium]